MNNLKFDINDNILLAFKNIVESYGFVKECLQSNNIYELYNKIEKEDYISSNRVSAITKLFYNSGIDPLDYLDKVPEHFLYMSTFSTDTPNIEIPSNIKTIERLSFAQCISLQSVKLSDGVKSIGDTAFAYCHQLKYIVINKDIEYLGKSILSFCGGLKDIIYLGTKQDWNKIVKNIHWDDNITATPVIKCKDGNIPL